MSPGHRPSSFDAPEGIACPWCGGTMKIRNVGAEGQPRRHVLVCVRYPADHAIQLDAGCSAGTNGAASGD